MAETNILADELLQLQNRVDEINDAFNCLSSRLKFVVEEPGPIKSVCGTEELASPAVEIVSILSNRLKDLCVEMQDVTSRLQI